MEFVETVKGNPCVVFDGYSYRKKSETKSGVVTWYCIYDKKSHCCAKLKTKDNDLIGILGEHKCIPDEAAVDVRKAVTSAKKRAREDAVPITQIYKEEFESLSTRGYEFVTKLPSFDGVRSTLYAHRSSAQGLQREPRDAAEVELDDETLRMNDGESFLLADEGATDRVVVFASTKGKELLREGKSFFMDGTFRSCSLQFTQIYSIHVDLGSSQDETNIVPVAFAILPDKKTETYIKLFRMILCEIPSWRPESITVDYESSVISALKEVFPLSKILGCFFHFSQRLWRKVQEVGMTTVYRGDEEVRRTIRMCAALAFLKPEDVDEGWMYIHSRAPQNGSLEQFFDYFISQWMENSCVAIEMWNCYLRRHRTTNAVEGWHSKLNTILGRPHPRVKTLVRCLKSEAEAADFKITRNQLNLEGTKRKKKYCQLDQRINRTTTAYQETGDVPKFLMTMSYILKLD